MKFGDFLKNAAMLYAAYNIIDKSIDARAKKMAKKLAKKERKRRKKNSYIDVDDYETLSYEDIE